MKMGRVLCGERISVRDYQKSDLAFVTEMCFDPENGRWMSDPTAEHVDETYRRALDEMEDCADGYYLIVQRQDSEERVGSACVFPDESGKTYDIGYCIRKDCWRQGYGTELAEGLIDWIRVQGGERVTAEVAMENAGSNALLRKMGFVRARESEFKKWNMNVRFKSWIYEKTL